jgi:hypothetical protein
MRNIYGTELRQMDRRTDVRVEVWDRDIIRYQ